MTGVQTCALPISSATATEAIASVPSVPQNISPTASTSAQASAQASAIALKNIENARILAERNAELKRLNMNRKRSNLNK